METEIKLCECGCGLPAPPRKKTNNRCGWRKGDPQRFIYGHFSRLRRKYASKAEKRAAYLERYWAKRGRKPAPKSCRKYPDDKPGSTNVTRQREWRKRRRENLIALGLFRTPGSSLLGAKEISVLKASQNV